MKAWLLLSLVAIALAQDGNTTPTDPAPGYLRGLARGLQASATTDGVCILGFTPLSNAWTALTTNMQSLSVFRSLETWLTFYDEWVLFMSRCTLDNFLQLIRTFMD